MTTMVRTHLVLPADLLDELDRRLGPRKRSEKFAELLAEYLRAERHVETIESLAGFASEEDHPEWATRDDIARWVRDERRKSDRTLPLTDRDDGVPG